MDGCKLHDRAVAREERPRRTAGGAQRPDGLIALMDRLIEARATISSGQIDAGAEAVQIFDSWAGDLTGLSSRILVVRPIAAIVREGAARHGHQCAGYRFCARRRCRTHGMSARDRGASRGRRTSLPLAWACEHCAGRHVPCKAISIPCSLSRRRGAQARRGGLSPGRAQGAPHLQSWPWHRPATDPATCGAGDRGTCAKVDERP